MNIPVDKNRRWAAGLYKGIDQLDENAKAALMRPAGQACADDIVVLCEKYLGRAVNTVADLVSGWNMVREDRNLTGKWEIKGDVIRATFGECGCPLVQSGLLELHPVHCYCSQGMMETVFSRISKKSVEVKINRSIGRGDDVCEFVIKL